MQLQQAPIMYTRKENSDDLDPLNNTDSLNSPESGTNPAISKSVQNSNPSFNLVRTQDADKNYITSGQPFQTLQNRKSAKKKSETNTTQNSKIGNLLKGLTDIVTGIGKKRDEKGNQQNDKQWNDALLDEPSALKKADNKKSAMPVIKPLRRRKGEGEQSPEDKALNSQANTSKYDGVKTPLDILYRKNSGFTNQDPKKDGAKNAKNDLKANQKALKSTASDKGPLFNKKSDASPKSNRSNTAGKTPVPDKSSIPKKSNATKKGSLPSVKGKLKASLGNKKHTEKSSSFQSSRNQALNKDAKNVSKLISDPAKGIGNPAPHNNEPNSEQKTHPYIGIKKPSPETDKDRNPTLADQAPQMETPQKAFATNQKANPNSSKITHLYIKPINKLDDASKNANSPILARRSSTSKENQKESRETATVKESPTNVKSSSENDLNKDTENITKATVDPVKATDSQAPDNIKSNGEQKPATSPSTESSPETTKQHNSTPTDQSSPKEAQQEMQNDLKSDQRTVKPPALSQELSPQNHETQAKSGASNVADQSPVQNESPVQQERCEIRNEDLNNGLEQIAKENINVNQEMSIAEEKYIQTPTAERIDSKNEPLNPNQPENQHPDKASEHLSRSKNADLSTQTERFAQKDSHTVKEGDRKKTDPEEFKNEEAPLMQTNEGNELSTYHRLHERPIPNMLPDCFLITEGHEAEKKDVIIYCTRCSSAVYEETILQHSGRCPNCNKPIHSDYLAP